MIQRDALACRVEPKRSKRAPNAVLLWPQAHEELYAMLWVWAGERTAVRADRRVERDAFRRGFRTPLEDLDPELADVKSSLA